MLSLLTSDNELPVPIVSDQRNGVWNFQGDCAHYSQKCNDSSRYNNVTKQRTARWVFASRNLHHIGYCLVTWCGIYARTWIPSNRKPLNTELHKRSERAEYVRPTREQQPREVFIRRHQRNKLGLLRSTKRNGSPRLSQQNRIIVQIWYGRRL